MCDQNRFHFGGTEPLAGYFNRVIAAAQNVPESIVIGRGPIAVDPDVGKSRPIGVDVTLSIFPEAARHSNPRLADYEFADLDRKSVVKGKSVQRGRCCV